MQCVPRQANYLILYYKIAFRPCRAWFSSSTSIRYSIQETGSGYPDFHCSIYVNKLISAFERMQREVKKRRVLRTPFWLESSARYCNVLDCPWCEALFSGGLVLVRSRVGQNWLSAGSTYEGTSELQSQGIHHQRGICLHFLSGCFWIMVRSTLFDFG